MSDRYLEVAREAVHEVKIQRSRFIGHVLQVRSLKEMQDKLREITELHRQANHNCWAYRIGAHPCREYWSDDGEPSGTAGKPILGALDRASVTNTLLVVTRYFGGIKRGVRGLIDAYGTVASESLDVAGIVERRLMNRYTLILPYETISPLLHLLGQYGAPQDEVVTEYGADVRMRCSVPRSAAEEFESLLSNWHGEGRLRGWRLLPGDEDL